MVFYKFHGNGNDFIIIDTFDDIVELSNSSINHICDRHFGIGADGLMIIEKDELFDFKMSYFNSDGYPGTMCGNGGRCAAAFAFWKGNANRKMKFVTSDGVHRAEILDDQESGFWIVDLELIDVIDIELSDKYYFIDTGSPHYVEFVDNIAEFDVFNEGKKTRYSEKFGPQGTNVNFVELSNDRIFVRTYERGVEDETLSCGTGVTASAIATFMETGESNINIHTSGGEFKVRFEHKKVDGVDKFEKIWLTGPVKFVFKGEIKL